EQTSRRLRWWLVLGASIGLGWWCIPEIAYFSVPAVGLVVWRAWRRTFAPALWQPVTALVAAGVGASPWLWANIGSGFASLSSGNGLHTSFGEHLRVLLV